MAHTVFVCHASHDKQVADAACAALEAQRIPCWIAPRDILAGEEYQESIVAALSDSQIVLLIFSPQANDSPQVRREIERAVSKGKIVVPFRIEDVMPSRAMEFALSNTHWLDALTPPLEHHLTELCHAISRLLLKHKEAEPPLWQPPAVANPTANTPSIAVLPLANMSRDADDEYFSDGLTEEIINALAKVPGLKVIARTSAFAFKGQNTDIRKIAETLGVANILEGSVRRSGTHLRVTAQLINAADGSHLWSERYDRELADVFAVQDEISAAITEALHTKLSPQAAAKPRYTPKLPAYEALLKARYFHWKGTAESMAHAKEFNEQAIALDPQYALAYAHYAEYLFGRTILGMTPMHEAAPLSRAMAQRALELDASLPEAHDILCVLAAAYDFNWQEASRQFNLATADDSASPSSHMLLGLCYLLASGRRKEAVDQLERAFQADPLHLTIRTVLAVCLGAAGRYAEAEEHFHEVLGLNTNFFLGNYFLAYLYAVRGMLKEALPVAEKAFSLAPWFKQNVGLYAGLLVCIGEQGRGKELIQTLGSGKAYGASLGWAIFHTVCGEIDLAEDWFEKCIEERYPTAAAVMQAASGEPLRASRHWPKLAALMNLPAVGLP